MNLVLIERVQSLVLDFGDGGLFFYIEDYLHTAIGVFLEGLDVFKVVHPEDGTDVLAHEIAINGNANLGLDSPTDGGFLNLVISTNLYRCDEGLGRPQKREPERNRNEKNQAHQPGKRSMERQSCH